MIRFAIALLAGLVSSAALAADEPRLEPGLYVQIPFGGARHAPADAHLSARLDYRTGPGGSFATPPVMQWRLDGRRSAVELLGLPVVEGLGYRLEATDDGGGNKAAKAVGFSVGGTLVVGGLVVWAASEALESFGEAFGEGVAEAVVDGMAPAEEEEGTDDAGETPACGGVQVGDECLGGG